MARSLRSIIPALRTFAVLGAVSCQTGEPAAPSIDGGTSSVSSRDDAGNSPGAQSSDGGTSYGAPSAGGGAPSLPFAAVPASVYVSKVKNLLTGLAAIDAEIASVTADSSALKGLIDQWTGRPEYKDKMIAFFLNAFQQGQITTADLMDQIPTGMTNNQQVATRLMTDITQSFALTAWELAAQGHPFTETMTTTRFMMTPPLMAFYAFLDEYHVDDALKRVDGVVQANPLFSFTVEAAGGAMPITQTLDPKSPNYMRWYSPALAMIKPQPGCTQDPRVYPKQSANLMQFLFGSVPQFTVPGTPPTTCNGISAPAQFADTEFDQWKMVTIRPPKTAESTTAFYDLPTLRTASELVLRIPRLGFFSTPAFFANWQTNSSNQARVTINQTLIVALGKSFDDTNSVTPVSETALDGQHAQPGSVCYGCHKTLDPMRQFYRQAYTLFYHDQLDPKEALVNGVFAFDGVTAQGQGIGDLGTMLANHPRFASAWVQKLCYYANSLACVEDDPEFLRIVAAFQQSNYSWSTLVREFFASPLTTGAADTKTFRDNGVVVPISRRDHYCVALSNRLGIADVCGMGDSLTPTASQRSARTIAVDLPADGYSRGAEAPILANDPTLFFRAGVENLCRIVADQVVDVPKTTKYSSTNPQVAIADFVSNVMGLPSSDSHAAGAQSILTDHFNAAKLSASATDALKSTFVLACTSPTAVGMGM
jgi:hypothetical protein